MPAIAVDSAPAPGSSFATTSERGPTRRYSDWVWRMQESGEIDTLQMVRSIGCPSRRPAKYQPVSAIRQATITAASTAPIDGPVSCMPSAPATNSIGYAGTGSPACSTSTFRNTSISPWFSSKACNSPTVFPPWFRLPVCQPEATDARAAFAWEHQND
ncbi:hypothetical protein D3C72_954040 [compost metagenome]